MGIRAGLLGIPCAAALAFAPGYAFGAARPLEVEWIAPHECSTKEQFTDGLSRPEETVSALQPLRVSMTITRKGPVYSGILLTNGAGRRTFEGSTCDEVIDAATLVLMMQLDNEIMPTGEDSEVAPDATPSGPYQAPIEPEFDEPPPRRRTKPVPEPRLSLGAATAIDLGTLSHALVGAEVSVGTEWDRIRLEAGGALFLPESREDATGQLSASAVYGHSRFSVRTFESRSVSLRPRITFTYTAVHVTNDQNAERSARGDWFTLGAGAALEIRFSRQVSIDFALDGATPTYRPRLGFEGSNLQERAKPIFARGYLGTHLFFF